VCPGTRPAFAPVPLPLPSSSGVPVPGFWVGFFGAGFGFFVAFLAMILTSDLLLFFYDV